VTTLQNFIDDVRTSLEDYGDSITDGNMTGDATTTRFKLSSPPIKTGSDVVTVGGVLQVNPTNYTINYDNGEMVFASIPANGAAIVVTYTKVVWRDERIISAINAGIRELYPALYRIGEIYVKTRSAVWEYDLTSTTDVPAANTFSDWTLPTTYNPATARTDAVRPQTRVHWMEYRPFGALQQFVPNEYFRRFDRNLRIDLDLLPSSTLRLVYSTGFTVLVATTDVSDVPDDFYMLPVWYALSVLMEKKEAKRVRFDQYSTMANQNATPVGTQAQTAEDYLKRYYETLRTNGMRPLNLRSRRQLRPWQITRGYE
jgi:hypothetical protein